MLFRSCRMLSRRRDEQTAGRQYRLPTEAEWEYACRAGAKTAFSFGNDGADLARYAWYEENSGLKTHAVGSKQPNAFGLYDMHGNVWEWCSDWYRGTYFASSPSTDPQGPESGRDAEQRTNGNSLCVSASPRANRPIAATHGGDTGTLRRDHEGHLAQRRRDAEQ